MTMESVTFQSSCDSTIHARITRPAKTASKPLLLFLHYWGGSSQTWQHLTNPNSPTSLSAHYPTLAVDLRGWGQSTGPSKDDGSAYSISAMASDVAALLVHLHDDKTKGDILENGFVFVGHSMGAKVALATIPLLKDHLQAQLKGLVLVGPAPPVAFSLPPEMKAQQVIAYESEDSVRWTVNNVLANPESISDSDIETVVHDSLKAHSLAKAAWPSYGMQQDVSDGVRKALASRSGLRASVVLGDQDIVETKERVEKEVVHFLRENGVEVSFTMVEGVKHLVPLEHPESIYKEICLYW